MYSRFVFAATHVQQYMRFTTEFVRCYMASIICYVLEVVVMTVSITLSTINSRSTNNCETIVPLTILAYG